MPKSEEVTAKKQLRLNERILRQKAEEVRRRLTDQRALQVVRRQECPSDEGDLSLQSHEEWLFVNRNTLEMMLLREVEQALLRIKEGSFGICQRCEEPISQKRLHAIPWANYCVPCQERIALGGSEADFNEAEGRE